MSAFNFSLPKLDVSGPAALSTVAATLAFMKNPVPLFMRNRAPGTVIPVANQSATAVMAFGADNIRVILTDETTWVRPRGGLLMPPNDVPKSRALMDMMLLMPAGEGHKKRRRVAVPPTHKVSALSAMESAMGEEAALAADRLADGEICDVRSLMTDIAFRNNVRCLLGLRNVERANRFRKIAENYWTQLLTPSTALTQKLARMAGVSKIPGTAYARWLQAGETLYDAILEIAREKRANPGDDMISAMALSRDEETKELLSDDELVGEILGLYAAGYETTASAMTWTLFLLAQHPETAYEVAAECAEVLRGGPVTMQNVNDLKKLDRVIKESLRLLPSTAMSIPRFASEDTVLGGVALPKGTGIFFSQVVEHRDPDVFTRPMQFIPSRWEKLQENKLTFSYLPFGAGSRRCLGAHVANLQMRSTIAALLQRHSFAVVDGQRIDYKTRQIQLMPGSPVMLKVMRTDQFGAPKRVSGSINDLVHFGV